MTVTLYASIWLATLLFVAGEWGKGSPSRATYPWTWRIHAAGVGLLTLHILIGLGHVHGWDPGRAMADTARQTLEIYGVAVGAGVYVNFLFVLVWAIDTGSWRASPGRAELRPAALRWSLRAFYFLILFNGTVVFAHGWRMALGAVLMAALAARWRSP